MRVCHFVTNPYTFDTRVKKQCESLVGLGCDVIAIGTARAELPARERLGGVQVMRLAPGRPALRTMRRLAGRTARDRLGHTRPWSAGAGVLRRLRAAGSTLRRWAARLRPVEPPAPAPEDALLEARRTESRFPLTAHLRFWGTILLAAVVVPVLAMLASILLALLAILRVIAVPTWRGLMRFLRAVRRRFGQLAERGWAALGRPTWRRVHGAGTQRLRPLRPRITRFARFLAMVEHGYNADANVYQANDYDTLAAGYWCALLRGVPFVYDAHELYDESFPTRKPFFTRYWIRLWEGYFGRRALRTITVGDNIARVLVERYRFAPPSVVHNAQVYHGQPEPDHYIRRSIDDPDRRRLVFVYAGRITRGRGLEESALAFARLPAERTALVIMGNADPRFLEQLRTTVQRHDLSDRVYLLDPVPADDLPAVLQGADVGLMLTSPACLSYYYGLGNKMFHYVNAGIPVLASRHPEKERFVTGHGVGLCVDRNEPEEIARTVRRLLEQPGDIALLKARCREVAPMVAWQREEEKYLDVFTDVYEHILFGAKGAA